MPGAAGHGQARQGFFVEQRNESFGRGGAGNGRALRGVAGRGAARRGEARQGFLTVQTNHLLRDRRATLPFDSFFFQEGCVSVRWGNVTQNQRGNDSRGCTKLVAVVRHRGSRRGWYYATSGVLIKAKECNMLVLHRKINEEIVIVVAGQQVVVKLVSVGGDGARIGVVADREVKVDRREVYERKQGDGNG